MYFDMATFTDSYPRHMRLLLLWANKQYDYDLVLVVPCTIDVFVISQTTY